MFKDHNPVSNLKEFEMSSLWVIAATLAMENEELQL